MDDDFFNFDSTLDDFPGPADEPKKFHLTNVWHEMGHLVGHQIAGKLGFHLGAIDKIDFGNAPRIFTLSMYSPAGKLMDCTDSYGLRNMCFDCQADIDRISQAVKNKRMTLAYFLYLLCGGLFNIYAVTKNPDSSDFEDCYLDSAEHEGVDYITARAGNDWSKLRRLAQFEMWDLGILKNLRSGLFFLFLDFGAFCLLAPFLDSVDEKYNGQLLSGKDLEALETELENILDGIDPVFWAQLESLLTEYELKL